MQPTVFHFHDKTGNYGIVSFTTDHISGTFTASMRNRPKNTNVRHFGYDLEEAPRYPRMLGPTGAPLNRDKPAGFTARQIG